MMVIARHVARLPASGLRQRIAISIECGLRNVAPAIAVATVLLDGATLGGHPLAEVVVLSFAPGRLRAGGRIAIRRADAGLREPAVGGIVCVVAGSAGESRG